MKQFLVKVPLRMAPVPQSPSHAHNPRLTLPHMLGCLGRGATCEMIVMYPAKWWGWHVTNGLAIVTGGVKNNPTNRLVTTFFFPSLIL